VLHELLNRSDERFVLLVRAADAAAAREKLWRGLQLHLDAPAFYKVLPRIDFVRGDLHAPGLGIDPQRRAELTDSVDSVLHIAASLNRKSAKACLNTNLRGTLSVVKLAREIADRSGLRRFSHVSTVAVAGQRDREVVLEDQAIQWDRSDYDPYGRTKKFCEHMIGELLPDVPQTFFRPSIVMGDSRFPDTSQFDMVRAFCGLADLPVVPLSPDVRLDIVPADFVGEAVARLHLAETTQHARYHLSAGVDSPTAAQVSEAMSVVGKRLRFLPRLQGSFGMAVRGMNRLPRGSALQPVGALMKVFWPYITYDTVFDNSRVCEELSLRPACFLDYCGPLYRYATGVNFRYPYRPLPVAQEAA
jgi:long-chain acyl-CoA synthetase